MSPSVDPPVQQMTTEDAAAASELTPQIGTVARAVLALNGYTRYEHLTGVTARQLLSLHGIGPKAVRILDEELAERGLAFSG